MLISYQSPLWHDFTPFNQAGCHRGLSHRTYSPQIRRRRHKATPGGAYALHADAWCKMRPDGQACYDVDLNGFFQLFCVHSTDKCTNSTYTDDTRRSRRRYEQIQRPLRPQTMTYFCLSFTFFRKVLVSNFLC